MLDIDRYAEGTPAGLVAECYKVWAREPFPKSGCKMIEAIEDIHDRIDALMDYIKFSDDCQEREYYEFRQVQILAVMHNDSSRFKEYFDRAEWAEDYSQTASWILFEKLDALIALYDFRWYDTSADEEELEYDSEEAWAEDLEDKEIQEIAFKTIIARLRSENAGLRDELEIDYKEQNIALREELEALKAEKAGLQAGGDTDHTEEQGRKKERGGYLGYSTTERAEALQILLEKALGREVVRDASGAFNKIYSMIAGSSVETTGRYIRNCKGEKMLNEGRRKKAEKEIQALLDAL